MQCCKTYLEGISIFSNYLFTCALSLLVFEKRQFLKRDKIIIEKMVLPRMDRHGVIQVRGYVISLPYLNFYFEYFY